MATATLIPVLPSRLMRSEAGRRGPVLIRNCPILVEFDADRMGLTVAATNRRIASGLAVPVFAEVDPAVANVWVGSLLEVREGRSKGRPTVVCDMAIDREMMPMLKGARLNYRSLKFLRRSRAIKTVSLLSRPAIEPGD